MPARPPRPEWSPPTDAAHAREIQARLAPRVEHGDRFGRLRTVAGVDVGFPDGGRLTRAAVVVLDFPQLTVRATAVAEMPTCFPCVPGLLSFREVPAVLAALEQLPQRPDLLLCDGQGLAHPRRFGLACHLGLACDLPALGAAKSRLIGRHEEPGRERGSLAPLIDRGGIVGCVVRTRTGVRPLYVSVGHRVSLDSAVRLVLAYTPRYRLPETTRAAHRLASGHGSAA